MTRLAAAAVLALLLLPSARVIPSTRDARERVQKLQSLPSTRVNPSTRDAREAPAEARVPFAVGESLTYDVSWSSYFTAGEATATVRDKRAGAGGPTYYIVAEGRPIGVVAYLYSAYYKVDTLLSASTLAPERGTMFLQENGRRQSKLSTFNQASHTVAYEVTGAAASPRRTVRIPPNTQDFLSAFYAIRTLTLKPGATAQMIAFDSGDVYRVRLTGGAIESIATGVGTMKAQRIGIDATTERGERVGNNLALWLSADARRLPVMLSADLPVGSFRLTLRSIK